MQIKTGSSVTVASIIAASLLPVGMSTAQRAAMPEPSTARTQIDIPSQPLADAIQAVARQTNFNILVDPRLVAGRHSPPINRLLSVDQALSQLLDGTGLTVKFVDEKTITLIDPAARTTSHVTNYSDVRLAQDSSAPSTADSSAASGESSHATADGTLEEVVVTAQKRAERLQDVPISITVLGGAELDGSRVEGITEALSRVPGTAVNVTYQGGATQLAIRGVTAGGPNFNGSSPVAYYLDSVPFGLIKTATAPDSNAYDLERVEVLRGPQGTLYGASAQNGVVRILTKDADPDQFELKARTSVATTEGGGESYRGDVAVNVPLVADKLAARAVLGYYDLGGWLDRPNKEDANASEIRNMRLKLNAQPTESLSIGISAWLSRIDAGPSTTNSEGRQTAIVDEPLAIDFDIYGFKLGYDFARFSVVSTTSYLDYVNDSLRDLRILIPDNASQTRFDASVFSHEINLNSGQGGSWRWSLGGIYRDAKDELYQGIVPVVGPVAVVSDQQNGSKSFAVFGELTRILFDGRFDLTGGLRYFEDDVSAREPQFSSEETFDAVSPRVVLTWHPYDRATLYASYAEGFRSGFDQGAVIKQAAPEFPPLDADTLMNYEVGAKGSLATGKLSYDAALYYIDWRDVQQSLTVPFNGLPFFASVNGVSASGAGFEFAIVARPVDRLELGVTLGWNDLAMDADVISDNTLLFAAGDRLNLSPEYTAGASMEYSFPLGGNGVEGRLSTSANYTSDMDVRTIVDGEQSIATGDPMLIARASFAIHAARNWIATLFVDNLNDEQGSPVRFPFLPGIDTDWNARVRPRTFGVQLEYRF
jgi:iron complex outermembrane recepter protein